MGALTVRSPARGEGIITRGRETARFGLVYFALFAIYGVASPYLQLLVRGLGYGPVLVGLVLGVFELVGIAGPLMVVRAANRLRSPRPALLACGLAVIASLPPLVLLPRPLVTFLAIALLSLGTRTLIPLMDAAAVNLSEKVSASGRGRGDYGRLRALGSGGFIAVTLLLQVLPGFDRSPPSRIALWIAISAAVFCLSLLALPVSPGRNSSSGQPKRAARRFDSVFILGLGIIALNRFAMAPVQSFLSLYVVEDLRWNAVGALWALAAISEIPLMIISTRFINRFGPMAVIASSGGAIALRLAIYALVPTPAGVVAGQLLHSICYGLFQPAAIAFVALRVPPERRAEGMAALMGLGFGLPSFLGSALGGVVVEAWGYRALFGSYILFAVGSLVLYSARRRRFGELERSE